MPDITMCGTRDCPLRPTCYRSPDSGTEQSWRQSWSAFAWREIEGRPTCDHYWPVEGRPGTGPDAPHEGGGAL